MSTTFLAGAISIVAIGFVGCDWRTAGNAESLAIEFAKTEVTSALIPICIGRAYDDPLFGSILGRMKELANTNRTKLVIQSGWATMPRSESPNLVVANACMNELMANH